MMSNNTRGNNN